MTRPAATPLVTDVSMKSILPAGAVPSEQLGHAVKSGYLKWPAPVLVITRIISCARQVAAKAATEVAAGGPLVVAVDDVHGLSPRLARTTAGTEP